jgi:hypothetical protein
MREAYVKNMLYLATASVALFVAGVGSAQTAPSKMFTEACALEHSDATCRCMVDEFQKTRDGQIALEVAETRSLGQGNRKQAFLEIMNKHYLKPSELIAIMESAKSLIDTTAKKCY